MPQPGGGDARACHQRDCGGASFNSKQLYAQFCRGTDRARGPGRHSKTHRKSHNRRWFGHNRACECRGVQANVTSQPAQTKVGDSVYLGDVVQTGADGKISITFTDDTAFNLSSNARMALNDFVYDPNGKSNSTLFNLTKGTFTFVAGKVAKTGDMKINTPVATMGIRGTTPHVEIAEDGSAKFSTLIEEGKTKVLEKLAAPVVQKHEQKTNLDICRGC